MSTAMNWKNLSTGGERLSRMLAITGALKGGRPTAGVPAAAPVPARIVLMEGSRARE